jgi:hypothetical protein
MGSQFRIITPLRSHAIGGAEKPEIIRRAQQMRLNRNPADIAVRGLLRQPHHNNTITLEIFRKKV